MSGGCGCGHGPGVAPSRTPPGGRAGKRDHLLDWTLNAWALERPGSLQVFAARGLDACCGGGLTLAEACSRHGLDADELLRELASC